MILTVLHPSYFPTTEYCARAMCADLVIWGDSFQFRKQGFINRTPIKTFAGAKWLSVPVSTKGKGTISINKLKIDNHQAWNKEHLRSIQINYQNSPYFLYYIDELKSILLEKENNANTLFYKTTLFTFEKLLLKKEIISSVNLPERTDRTERVIEWLKQCNCRTYLIDSTEQNLIDIPKINKAGYEVKTFSYKNNAYFQQFGEFIPSMSSLDLLFNEGEQGQLILKSGISD